MTISHIDQLAEWWENAEEGVVQPGDTVIGLTDADNDAYEVFVAQSGESEEYDFYRILSRAPKPAWHDAVAVMARCSGAPEGHREPFIRSEVTPGVWIGEGGHGHTEVLRDVTPLIEAKVADEMVARAMKFWDPDCPGEHDAGDIQWAREFITAALGLETE